VNRVSALLIIFTLCSYSALAQAADAARGALISQARCATCHHLHRITPLIGPSLRGIFGRAPSIRGVPFSRWGRQELDAWISNPRVIKPNTKMKIPPIKAQDRADLIAYFQAQASPLQE
jgi:cytochrome c